MNARKRVSRCLLPFHSSVLIPSLTAITLNVQEAPNNTTCPLNQVPPPFVLPDTTQQLNAPVTTTNALPLIVSSSAESNEDPQVVNVPDATENPSPEQSSSNGSKTDSSLSRENVNSGDKTLNESSSGSGGKLGGILSNWAPAAALKRPLGMNRSLSEFFGLKASNTVSEPADDDRTPPAQGERRVSHSSTNSDGSSMVEDGKSGILYYRAKDKRGSTETTGNGWNLGERRSKKLPEGASGVALHQDLWKVSLAIADLDSYSDTLLQLDQMSETCDFPECSVTFSFTNRRHHCRTCGQIFCTPHASYALNLWYPATDNSDEPKSSSSSRRPSKDATVPLSRSPDQTDLNASSTILNAPGNSLLRLPARKQSQGVIKPARVCEDCYDKVWHPNRYVTRERARRAPGASGVHIDVDSDSQASNSGFSLVSDPRHAATAHLLNDRVLHRSHSARASGRRMFSAPVSPASTSPPKPNSGLDAAVHALLNNENTIVTSRSSSRSSSLAPPGARQNARLARHASAHAGLSLRNRLPPTSPGSLFDNVTPRPMFSPTAEALNVLGPQRSLSPHGGPSTSGNGYFPAMPPPSKPFLPGEEPNQHVNGVLSNYPLAYKPTTPGSSATSPYTSGPPSSADLNALARRMHGSRQNPNHMRIDMPKNGFMLDDPMSSKASSARLLTPEREWVPGAWGYAKETFDPDVESDTEDEDDAGGQVDGLANRTRSRLIIDGGKLRGFLAFCHR